MSFPDYRQLKEEMKLVPEGEEYEDIDPEDERIEYAGEEEKLSPRIESPGRPSARPTIGGVGGRTTADAGAARSISVPPGIGP